VLRKISQLAVVLGALSLAAGCQLLGWDEGDNALANPGFEAGREGWVWLDRSPHWSDFAIVETPVRSGRKAVHLALRQGAIEPPPRTRVYGVVQELPPDVVPERVGGWYRVERWEKDAPGAQLYLQLVAIVWGDPRTPELVNPERPPRRLENFQLRYYLAGVAKPAFELVNGRILFVSRELPVLGEWIHFEVPVAADLMREWGVRPEGHDFIRLLFEARWDNLSSGGSVHADVYFDDLYAR
jgi:hypothetical protein